MADALRALVADAPNAAELVNQVDNKGLTPLLQIVITFDTVANVSLSRGGKLAPKGMHGYVTDAVEVLLKAGASMAATDSEKRGALYHAFFNLNASLVRLLYKHGASTGDMSEPQKSDIKRRVKSAMNENSGPWEDDWFKDHIKSL